MHLSLNLKSTMHWTRAIGALEQEYCQCCGLCWETLGIGHATSKSIATGAMRKWRARNAAKEKAESLSGGDDILLLE